MPKSVYKSQCKTQLKRKHADLTHLLKRKISLSAAAKTIQVSIDEAWFIISTYAEEKETKKLQRVRLLSQKHYPGDLVRKTKVGQKLCSSRMSVRQVGSLNQPLLYQEPFFTTCPYSSPVQHQCCMKPYSCPCCAL